MDFIKGLPPMKGYSKVFVVINRLIKYSHFIPVKHPYTTSSISELIQRNVIKLHGPSKSIVCDRDTIFCSQYWQQVFANFYTKLCLSTAYHPQIDGQIEAVNRCLKTTYAATAPQHQNHGYSASLVWNIGSIQPGNQPPTIHHLRWFMQASASTAALHQRHHLRPHHGRTITSAVSHPRATQSPPPSCPATHGATG